SVRGSGGHHRHAGGEMPHDLAEAELVRHFLCAHWDAGIRWSAPKPRESRPFGHGPGVLDLLSGQAFRRLAPLGLLAGILISSTACDNVEWGGVSARM